MKHILMFIHNIKIYKFRVYRFASIILACILLASTPVEIVSKKELREQVSANSELFRRNIDSAFQELPQLLELAINIEDTLTALELLESQCNYYYSKSKVEQLFETAKHYKNYANKHKAYKDLAVSHIFMAEAYSFTELYNKSLIELDEAWKILEKKESDKQLDAYLHTKINILTSYANVYLQQNKSQEAIDYLRKINELVLKTEDEEQIKSFQYTNYSNLSSIFMLFDMDSAKHYAELSTRIFPEEMQDPTVESQNLFVLGRYYELNKNDSLALQLYLQAHAKLKANGEELNSKALYISIVNLSKKIGEEEISEKFEALLQQVEQNLLQSKYNSINRMLDIQPSQKLTQRIWIVILSVFLILAGALFFYIKWTASKKKEEILINPDNFDNLLKMAESDDAGFMNAFEQLYPDFTQKLLNINSSLSRTEIEFCALLKMNQTTKQISILKSIEVRTVQNKKYRIRKRLNLPESTDIYNWFELI